MSVFINKLNSWTSSLLAPRSQSTNPSSSEGLIEIPIMVNNLTKSIQKSYQDSFEALRAIPGLDEGLIYIRRDLAQRRIAKNTQEKILAMEFTSFKNFWDKYHNQGGDASLRLCDLSA
jgi:hypothetical protein